MLQVVRPSIPGYQKSRRKLLQYSAANRRQDKFGLELDLLDLIEHH